ncbi:MAG: GNAT family N-acetyltransferase [Candidatus Hodarchaeota archaeon]
MINKVLPGNAREVFHVINTSNKEAFKNIIPREYFIDPVLSFEEFLEEFKNAEFYSYTSKGKIVAVSALEFESDKIGKINWVYVLPQWQRKGIGTALINYLETKAKKIGLRTLRLITIEKATSAVNFYIKLGYQITKRIERKWGFDISMEKEL